MKYQFIAGRQNVSILIFIADSSQTDGRGLTGLAFDSANLACYYVRPGSAPVAISLVTQTVTGTHSDGGFVEIDATNMPGWYRLDIPDAVCASGILSVGISLRGATNMVPCNSEIQLENTVLISGTRQTLDVLRNFDPDVDILENGRTFSQIWRRMKAWLCGNTTTTGTVARDDANSKNRGSVSIVDGNRTFTNTDDD